MIATSANTEPTQEQVERAADAILVELTAHGALKELHDDAFKTFLNKDFTKIKLMAACNLEDSFLRSLTYLSSALTTKQPSATPTILAEAARAASDYSKERTLRNLSGQITEIFR
jgi:hypothetical protein